MTRRFLRAAACTVAMMMATVFPRSGVSAQQERPFEEGIVELHAQRLPALTLVVIVDSAGALLLPVREVARHLGYAVNGTAETLTLPRLGGGTWRIDVRARTLAAAGDTLRLAPAELVTAYDDVFLRAQRVAELLDAELTYDAATLVVSLQRPAPFPAQQRVLAEQRRTLMLAATRSGDGGLDMLPYRNVSGGAIVDWRVTTSGMDPFRLTTLRTRTGVAVLGGDLTAGSSLELGREPKRLVRDVDVQYQRVLPAGSFIRQVTAGDLGTSGLFARYVRGAEISNRPHMRDIHFAEVLLRPDLPPGWEYEVFQGSQLLGYSTPGARDAVTVPLRGGTTPVQVRMFGPAGEEVVSTLLYQLPMSLLRDGAFEYVLGGGRCEGSPCDRFAHADARYGVTSHVTLGGGAEYVADSAGTAVRPYALGSFTTGQLLMGEVQLMPGALASGLLTLFPRETSTAWLRTSFSRPGFGTLSVIPDDDTRWDTELSWEERASRRTGARARLASVRLSAGAAGRTSAGVERLRVTAGAGFRSGRAEARYEYMRDGVEPHMLSGTALVLAPFRLRSATHRPLLHATLGGDRAGLSLADAGITVQPASSAQLAAAVQWSRASREPAFSLTWIMRAGGVQSFVRAAGGRGGAASSAAMLSGSAALAGDGVLIGDAAARTGYAGVHGMVFFDNDGDGVFSAGDEPLPHANVVVGGAPVTADVGGRYHIWSLHPYQPVTVAVDSSRIQDPGWMVAGPPRVTRTAPNTAIRVDVPLVRTRELIGSVIAGDGVRTAAALTLTITNVATAEVTTTVTFSDGQFYVSRIAPGRYRLTVAPSSLDLVNATAAPPVVEFTAQLIGGEPVIELPPILLESRR
jgi:hypothetical protein